MSDTNTPLNDAIAKIGTTGEGFDLGVRKDADDVGVSASGSKELGKGWTVAGAVQWMKDAGTSAWGGFSWRPKR